MMRQRDFSGGGVDIPAEQPGLAPRVQRCLLVT
jgi:hypothetical protein